MRTVDAGAILYTHKLEQKAIGKDWGVDDLAAAIKTAPTIEAIPIEWMREMLDVTDGLVEPHFAFAYVLREWQKTKSIEEQQAESETCDVTAEKEDEYEVT